MASRSFSFALTLGACQLARDHTILYADSHASIIKYVHSHSVHLHIYLSGLYIDINILQSQLSQSLAPVLVASDLRMVRSDSSPIVVA